MTDNIVDSALKTLGLKGRDRITNFEGVITTVGFDLYGCVQVVLNPGLDKDFKLRESLWFDFKRIDVSTERAMDAPAFAATQAGREIGAGEKPAFTIFGTKP